MARDGPLLHLNNGTNAPDIRDVIDAAEAVRGVNLRAVTRDEVEARVDRLLRLRPGIGVTRDSVHVWHRARICKSPEGFSNIREVLYPPAEMTGAGRANVPRRPALYASWNFMTALEEVEVQAGDIVQQVVIRVVPGVQFPCVPVGDFAHVMSSGRSYINSRLMEDGVAALRSTLHPVDFYGRWYIDAFLAQEYRAKRSHDYEYKATAAHADLMARRAGGGVIFPSVAHTGSVNLAVPAAEFDRNFEVLYTQVFRVARALDYGIFGLGPLRGTCEIKPDGELMWNSTITTGGTVTGGLINAEQHPETFRGWRMPATTRPIARADEDVSASPHE